MSTKLNPYEQFALFDDLPTTTVHQARLQIFQPTRRPKDQIRVIESPWGSAVIDGKLGQAHADFLESIFFHAEKKRQLEDGRIQILIDPHTIRMILGGGKQCSGEQLTKVQDEIMKVLVEVKIPDQDIDEKGHIIDLIEKSSFTKRNPLGGQRQMWRVTISRPFVRLMGKDLGLHYNPAPIACLTTGVAQAVARHCATHKNQPTGGWHIDGLIKVVGCSEKEQSMKDRRRDLQKDKDGLKHLGLIVEDGRIRRENS